MKEEQFMRTLKVKSVYNIVGRGTVYGISLRENNLTPLKSQFEIKVGDEVRIENKTYIVKGIESFATLEDIVEDSVGLLVKPVEMSKEINWTNSSDILQQDINKQLQRYKEKGMLDMNGISDGYHTFGELYEHRIALYIALCKELDDTGKSEIWKSKTHSDGSVWEGWFLLGIGTKPGKQITYHLPMNYFPQCSFAKTLDKAPDFDGHTSSDVLDRIKNI